MEDLLSGLAVTVIHLLHAGSSFTNITIHLMQCVLTTTHHFWFSTGTELLKKYIKPSFCFVVLTRGEAACNHVCKAVSPQSLELIDLHKNTYYLMCSWFYMISSLWMWKVQNLFHELFLYAWSCLFVQSFANIGKQPKFYLHNRQ